MQAVGSAGVPLLSGSFWHFRFLQVHGIWMDLAVSHVCLVLKTLEKHEFNGASFILTPGAVAIPL